jgi:hypothetical protein
VFSLVLSLVGIVSSVAMSARLVVRGDLAEQFDTGYVNSFIVAAERVAMLAAPLGAAVTATPENVELGFYAEAAALVLSSGLIVAVPASRDRVKGSGVSGRRSGRRSRFFQRCRSLVDEVIAYFCMMRDASTAVGAISVSSFGYMFYLGLRRVLLPIYIVASLNEPLNALGYIYAASAIGGLLGAIASPLVTRNAHLICAYVVLTVMEAGAFLTLFLVETLTWTLVVFAVSGFMEAVATAVFFVVVQAQVRPSRQGTFFGFFLPQCELFVGVGALFAGLLAGLPLVYSLGVVSAAVLVLPLLLFSSSWGRRRAPGCG